MPKQQRRPTEVPQNSSLQKKETTYFFVGVDQLTEALLPPQGVLEHVLILIVWVWLFAVVARTPLTYHLRTSKVSLESVYNCYCAFRFPGLPDLQP